MNFCKMKKCQLMLLSKIFKKLSMFLLFLCPGTIQVPSCRTSCQATSSPPPSSESVEAASSHPFSRSTMAPTPSYTAGSAPSLSESGPRTRSLPSAASRLAQSRTPRLAAHVAAAGRRVRTQAAQPPPSGSGFQTRWFLHLPSQRRHKTVLEPFSYPARRFLHARDRRRLHRCHRRGTRPVNGHRPRGLTSDLFSFQPRPELRGSPVDTCSHPKSTVRLVGCTPTARDSTCTVSVYKLICNCTVN
jgi:hypothetical protein